MPYQKSTLNSLSTSRKKYTSGLFSKCLGAWYFNTPTHVFPDLTGGNHVMTRRDTGTQSSDLSSKFNAITPYNGALNPADNFALLSADPAFTIYDAITANTKKYSCAVWLYTNGAALAAQILSIGGEVSPSNNYGIRLEDDGSCSFCTGMGNNVFGLTSIRNTGWHLAGGSFDGTNGRIYIDGQLDNTANLTPASPATGIVNVISYSELSQPLYSTGVYFTAIWNRVLTPGEFFTLFYNPSIMLSYPLVVRTNAQASSRRYDLMPFMPM